jgi:uncharacterized repeat protein (TIGR04076 family)
MDKEAAEKIERRWKRFQESIGYTDEQIAIFRSNPQKAKAMERASKFGKYNIIAECVVSHNCVAGHKVGDRIVLSGNGNILCRENPDHICYAVIQVIVPFISAIWERFYEDLDDLTTRSQLVHCPDVGVEKGGWGDTVWKVYAELKKRT